MSNIQSVVQTIVDHPATTTLSFGTLFGSLATILPPVAAVFTIVWTAIKIYFEPGIQKWMKKRGWIKDED
jgi:hypothetical protein